MKLGYTILYVADVGASVDFYERAFGLQRAMMHETEYAELDTGATRLAFARDGFIRELLPLAFTRAEPGGAAAAMEIGLVTDDVEAAWRRALEAGATAVVAPERKPWGQVVAHVRDLNGFIVELCTAPGA
jgi:uncharacterized glyoxalase superfamily protein PhnB